jgi:DNA-binding GntR family transcriptional regulator
VRVEAGLGRGENFLIAMALRHTTGKAAKPVGEDRGAAFALAAGSRRITLDRRRSIAPQIAGVLRAMIVELTLEPGSAIAKDAVARAFGVSSMPVREAFNELEEEGLVVIKPQSGTYVATINVQEAREAQFLRIGIEVEIVRSLVKTVTEQEIQELQDILRRQQAERSIDDRAGFISDDGAFHAAMCRMAGVGGLWQKIETMAMHIDRLRRLHLPMGGEMEQILADHLLILDAIRKRDAEAAEACLRRHLSDTLPFADAIEEKYPSYF